MIDKPSLLISAAIGSTNVTLSAPQRLLASDIAKAPIGSADAPEEVGTQGADSETSVGVREAAASRQAEKAEPSRSSMVTAPVSIADMWRTRMDPETFLMFTEIIDLETRDPMYRVPPRPISDAAEQEGELLSRRERWQIDLAQSIEV